MKKTKITYIITAFITAALVFTLAGCDIKSPVDGVKVIFNTAAVETVVSVDFRDANTDAQITNPVMVTFSGEDEEVVTNLVQEEISSIEAKSGLVNFSFKEGTTPSASNPVDLVLKITADGYVKTSKAISVKNTGDFSFTVYMVNKSNVPDGATAKSQSGGTAASNGAVTSEIIYDAGSQAEITIPQGTQLLDESGAPLQGNLSADMIYYNPLNEEAISAFPGGSYTNVQGEGNSYLVSAGFVSVDIYDGSGKEAVTFAGGSVGLDIAIPDGTINPNTGEEIKQGDQIPVYSYNETTGVWRFESTSTVESSRNGLLQAEIKNVPHLSFWALAFLWDDFCEPGPTFTVNGSFSSLTVTVGSSDFGLEESYAITPTNVPYTLPAAPRGLPIDVTVKNNATNEILLTQTYNDLCSETTIAVNMPSNTNTIDVEVEIEAYCENNDDVAIRPDDIPVYMKSVGGTYNYIGRLNEGKITVPDLVNGAEYDFGIYYEGEFYERTFTVNGPTFKPEPYELDPDYCEDI